MLTPPKLIYKEGKIHEDSYLELTLELKRHDVLFKSKLLHSELLRTSTSSPSWIFEALVPVPFIVEDVLVFVHGILDSRILVGEQTTGIQSRSLRAETRDLEI